MTNKYIEVVKKWITGEAVSPEELKTNFEDASQDYYSYSNANTGVQDAAWSLKGYANFAIAAAYDSATTTAGAIAASNAAEAADHWVKQYDLLILNLYQMDLVRGVNQ